MGEQLVHLELIKSDISDKDKEAAEAWLRAAEAIINPIVKAELDRITTDLWCYGVASFQMGPEPQSADHAALSSPGRSQT